MRSAAALLLLLAAAAPEEAAQRFMERPAEVAAAGAAIARQARAMPGTCPELVLTPSPPLLDPAAPPMFDAGGTLVAGSLRQSFSGSGCGAFAPEFHVWAIAGSGETRLVAAYPGTSLASPDLQAEATPTATVAAGRMLGGCAALDVIDTRAAPGAAGTAAAGASWQEFWLVGGCDMYATTLLRFVPDGTGRIAVEAPLEGVRRILVR